MPVQLNMRNLHERRTEYCVCLCVSGAEMVSASPLAQESSKYCFIAVHIAQVAQPMLFKWAMQRGQCKQQSRNAA